MGRYVGVEARRACRLAAAARRGGGASHVLFPMREENRGLLVALPVVLTGVDLRLLGTRESRRPAARLLGRPVT